MSWIDDDRVKVLLNRCKNIKALTLEATWITDDSLKNIRKHLNLTLEELSLGPNDDSLLSLEFDPIDRYAVKDFREDWEANPPNISLIGYLELKFMPKLRILNLYYEKDSEEIQGLREHLPNLTIKGGL